MNFCVILKEISMQKITCNNKVCMLSINFLPFQNIHVLFLIVGVSCFFPKDHNFMYQRERMCEWKIINDFYALLILISYVCDLLIYEKRHNKNTQTA